MSRSKVGTQLMKGSNCMDGISALVGFGILAILTPVPTHVGRLMVGVQKEKMEMASPQQLLPYSHR